MNSALDRLKRSNPRLYQIFLEALTQDLGFARNEAIVSFSCPNCSTKLEVTLAAEASRAKLQGKGGVSRVTARKLPRINDFLIELARLRKTTTGTINADFSKRYGRTIRNLTAKQVRERKIVWLKAEIAKLRSKANAA